MEHLRPRAENLTPQKVNRGQIRTDDYSIIGAAVGALAGPAIFLRRAPTVTLVLGGAAIGLGAGVWTHIVQSFTKGEDIKPEQMVSAEEPVAVRRDAGDGVARFSMLVTLYHSPAFALTFLSRLPNSYSIRTAYC